MLYLCRCKNTKKQIEDRRRKDSGQYFIVVGKPMWSIDFLFSISEAIETKNKQRPKR